MTRSQLREALQSLLEGDRRGMVPRNCRTVCWWGNLEVRLDLNLRRSDVDTDYHLGRTAPSWLAIAGSRHLRRRRGAQSGVAQKFRTLFSCPANLRSQMGNKDVDIGGENDRKSPERRVHAALSLAML